MLLPGDRRATEVEARAARLGRGPRPPGTDRADHHGARGLSRATLGRGLLGHRAGEPRPAGVLRLALRPALSGRPRGQRPRLARAAGLRLRGASRRCSLDQAAGAGRLSGAAIGLEAGPVGLAGRGRATAAVAERPLPFAVELGLFALIAAFSMALWARLVEPSSADRQALALLVVAAGAIALQLLGRVGSRGGRRTLCIAVAFATVIGALRRRRPAGAPARAGPVGRAADADPGRHGRDRGGRAALRRRPTRGSG